MPKYLYDKLSDIKILQRAWHLARNDSRADFMFDPYRFSDFAFRLDIHLQGIQRNLKSRMYHPNPLLNIDVPKSSLAVRPGSVLSIEDKIVMFAIASLIAPLLDKKLPATVYSWRLKKGKKQLFHDHELLKFPFLKRTTIKRRVDFVEPWYATWPRFIEELEIAYEKEGYCHMVASDITAYFENIDLGLLRDLLLQHLPHQHRIINFLISLLQFWSWPTIYGGSSMRGIPQGNGVSSFLGNIYLLPLDKAFQQLSKCRDIKYFRYMDDVEVMTKDVHIARDCLFLMNEKLRELRLNIQGSKTRILQGSEIKDELFDDRRDRVNKVIDTIERRRKFSIGERVDFFNRLKEEQKKVIGRRKLIRDKELRLFRRIITGFTLLRHPGIVSTVLNQMERNPDSRLLNSAVRYTRTQSRKTTITNRFVDFLINRKLLFPYQEAHCFMALRYQRDISSNIWEEARKKLRSRKTHWYVRQQAAQLISLKSLSKIELDSLRKQSSEEVNIEVKRTMMQALTQYPREGLVEIARELLDETDPKLQRLGHYWNGMLSDKSKANEQIKSLFRDFCEDVLIDRLYEVEIVAKAEDPVIRRKILSNLKRVQKSIHKLILKKRVDSIISKLTRDLKP